jgi:hypothetical protein
MCDVLKCSSAPKILKYESRLESKDRLRIAARG